MSKSDDTGTYPPEKFEKELEALYLNNYIEIFKFIYNRIERKEDASDIVATAFLKALKNREKFKKQDSGSLKSWIFKIAYNEVLLFYRKKKIERKYFIEKRFLQDLGEEIPDCNVEFDLLHKSLETLRKDEYELVQMKYFDNLPFKEISEITGKSEESLRTALYRIRKNLYKILTRMMHDKGVEVLFSILFTGLNYLIF
jgi:RNA polymerase sigma-70 factor (ECF subfamily)